MKFFLVLINGLFNGKREKRNGESWKGIERKKDMLIHALQTVERRNRRKKENHLNTKNFNRKRKREKDKTKEIYLRSPLS